MAQPVAQPQLTWNLDPTATGLMNVFIRFLGATTRDNFQVLAISACEVFGGTLALSLDTRETIEKTILPTPRATVVNFLNTLVGFYKDEAVTVLRLTVAGIQFLGLACALLTVPLPDAAEALRDMLRSTASHSKHVPPMEHLKQFLKCLEPRCSKSTFMAKVNEYEWHIRHSSHFFGSNGRPIGESKETAPSPKGLSVLVRVFRELCRVGDTETHGAEIRVGACAAWVAAFSEWCLGVKPLIILETKQSLYQTLLESNDSIVKIIIPADADSSSISLSATIFRKVGDLEALVGSGKEPQYGGRVTIEEYGNWLSWDYSFS